MSEFIQWAAFIGIVGIFFTLFAIAIGPDPVHRCHEFCNCFRH